MSVKILLLAALLLLPRLGAQAQLRAERKALRVFSHHILRHVNTKDFYYNDSVTTINYDGTVAPYSIGERWILPVWHKDVRGQSRKHFVMRRAKPRVSNHAKSRNLHRRLKRKLAIEHDFDSATYVGDDQRHDLRQRDSLSTQRLPVLAPLRRVPSAAYQHLDPYRCDADTYLTVHHALVGRRYVVVGLVVGCTAECVTRSSVTVVVLLHRRTLLLADWWYIIVPPNTR